MNLVRNALGMLIVGFDKIFQARPDEKTRKRSGQRQREIDEACKKLSLYQFTGCPFCLKVRRGMKRMGLNKIEFRQCEENAPGGYREELIREGGQLQTPCLRIEEAHGKVTWLYESDDILSYLQERFA